MKDTRIVKKYCKSKILKIIDLHLKVKTIKMVNSIYLIKFQVNILFWLLKKDSILIVNK
jgi:hypothetical protein